MTNQALPGRPPPHDLSAFDLSKRSPEQVALSFARWKAQRKRSEASPARADPLPSPKSKYQVESTGEATLGQAAAPSKRASAKRAGSLQYSVPFSDLLAAGSEPAVQRTPRATIAALRAPQRTASPGRRLRVMSILAGAASVCALAGGALLEFAGGSDPAEPAPQVAQARPWEILGSLAAAATGVATVEWKLQPTLDLALMKSDAVPPASPTSAAPTPAIQTASKAEPVADHQPVLPTRKSPAPEPEPVRFVAKPFVPDVERPPARIPAPPVAAVVHTRDPRPDALFQHGRNDRSAAASTRAASSGKPAAATRSADAVEARSASAGSATAASGGQHDPRGEGSGGARAGIAGEVGAGTASDASGGESGTGDAGDGGTKGASSDSGSNAAAASGDDTGGDSTTGGGSSGDSAGSGNPGAGDSGNGDASGGESGDGDSGGDADSGGVGGALGAVGDALGGALGGGKGNPDNDDKD